MTFDLPTYSKMEVNIDSPTAPPLSSVNVQLVEPGVDSADIDIVTVSQKHDQYVPTDDALTIPEEDGFCCRFKSYSNHFACICYDKSCDILSALLCVLLILGVIGGAIIGVVFLASYRTDKRNTCLDRQNNRDVPAISTFYGVEDGYMIFNYTEDFKNDRCKVLVKLEGKTFKQGDQLQVFIPRNTRHGECSFDKEDRDENKCDYIEFVAVIVISSVFIACCFTCLLRVFQELGIACGCKICEHCG